MVGWCDSDVKHGDMTNDPCSAFCGRRKWMRPSPRSTWAMEQWLCQLGSWNAPRCQLKRMDTPLQFTLWKASKFQEWQAWNDLVNMVNWKVFWLQLLAPKRCPMVMLSNEVFVTCGNPNMKGEGLLFDKADKAWLDQDKEKTTRKIWWRRLLKIASFFSIFYPVCFSAGTPIGWHISVEASLWRGWWLRHVDRFLEAAEDVEVTSGWEARGKFKELELGDAGDLGDVSHPK